MIKILFVICLAAPAYALGFYHGLDKGYPMGLSDGLKIMEKKIRK